MIQARGLAKTVLCVALLASLSGCVEMLVGSAVVGAVATADRRTYGAQTEDKAIDVKAELRIPKITGDAGHVSANSYNRKVLLTGEVKDEAMKAAVERDVRAIEGVQGVVNELEIGGPSSYTSRSSDALITTKVKASLVDNKDVSATTIKVVTERGVVYLMGRVTEREGKIAAEVARGVSGVNKVVKVFEYISEEELKALQPAAKQPESK
ncbi:MAG: BON domain-containing protein [Telluria sp.]|jgi:osmotically-inducible protein OsmY